MVCYTIPYDITFTYGDLSSRDGVSQEKGCSQEFLGGSRGGYKETSGK